VARPRAAAGDVGGGVGGACARCGIAAAGAADAAVLQLKQAARESEGVRGRRGVEAAAAAAAARLRRRVHLHRAVGHEAARVPALLGRPVGDVHGGGDVLEAKAELVPVDGRLGPCGLRLRPAR